jgi:transcriptional regulator with XRE-family HTH domain
MKTPPNPIYRKTFAKNVKTYRSILEISQEELADKAGMSRAYVSGIETSVRNVSLDNMGKLADALGVPLSDLVDPGLLGRIKSKSE